MGASGALWEMLYKQYADRPIHTRTRSKETPDAASKMAHFAWKESGGY